MIPIVGLGIQDVDELNRANAGYRVHDGRVGIPRCFLVDGGQLVGLCNGRQTHDVVTHLIERAKAGEYIQLFGYTFDHPATAEASTNAAIRGVFVRLARKWKG